MKKVFFVALVFISTQSVFAQTPEPVVVYIDHPKPVQNPPNDSNRLSFKDFADALNAKLGITQPDNIIKTKDSVTWVYGQFQNTVSKEYYFQCLDRWIQQKEGELQRKSYQSNYPQPWGNSPQQMPSYPPTTNGQTWPY
jgi:hypothetical protein